MSLLSPVPTSTSRPTRGLLELITARNWPSVLERCHTHPEDVQYNQGHEESNDHENAENVRTPRRTFGYNASPLHLSCLCRAPSDVIMCLFSVNPPAIFVQDTEGWTPLHELLKLSTHNYNHETVLFPLIQTWGLPCHASTRSSSLHTTYGYTPLHIACQHNASSQIIRQLLHAHPSMCCAVDENGETPGYILWDKFIRQLKNRVTLTRVGRRGRSLFQDVDLTRLLEKIGLFFQAAAIVASCSYPELYPSLTSKKIKTGDFHIIDLNHENDPYAKRLPHLAVEFCDLLCLQCDFLYLIFRLYPETLLEPDHNDRDRLPLHKAAAFTQKRSYLRKACRRRKHSFQRSSANDVVLEELVRACPQAAEVRDGDGRLPLFLAIETGKEQGIPLIFYSYPNVLMTRDSISHLFPFMYAACCKEEITLKKEGNIVSQKEDSLTSLTAIYGLLRASPEQIRGGALLLY